MTGGGLVLGLSCVGSTETRPLTVENQSLPVRVRHAADCEPEVHSFEGNPSRCP